MTKPLSPAAQQVFWEFNHAASGKPDDWHYLPAIAAALRAAADKTCPQSRIRAQNDVRYKLLAIADELESQ
jgi:hypothetical protein